MDLQTSKLLGGIGALIIFLSVFTILIRNVTPIGITVIIGSMLVLISLYSLAKIYKDKAIFTNALYGALTAIIGTIISSIAAIIIILPTIMNLIRQASQIADGNPGDIVSGFLNTIDTTFILQIFNGVLTVYYVMCLFIIIAMFFTYRSLKKLAKQSNTNLFATTGLMLIIGALTTLFFIGLLLLWISTLMLAIAFFTLKEPKPTPPPTINISSPQPQTTTTTTTENTQTKIYCIYCGTPTPPENAFCHQCGKQK